MASKVVDIYWSSPGQKFDQLLRLNSLVGDEFPFRSKGVDLMGGPEQEVVLGDTEYSVPFDIRGKLHARAFSVVVSIQESGYVYDSTFQQRRNQLLKAVYSGIVRVGVYRAGVGYVFLEARVEGCKEIDKGIFEIAFLAADPIFTQYDPDAVPPPGPYEPGDIDPSDYMISFVEDDTNSGDPDPGVPTDQYNPSQVTPYAGTAPSEPTVVFEVGGDGRVWRYRREFSVTNNSPIAWHNHPVCIELGHVLGTGNTLDGKAKPDLGDLRIETYGGTRKAIYVRRYSPRNTGEYCRVWFVINSLAPGETKKFRLLYGNPYVGNEGENFSIKPMFSMYDSTNAQWIYNDFQPRYDQPQSRIAQWVEHLQSRQNITWQAYPHAAFPITDDTLVNTAMGKATYHGRANGYAGLQLAVPVAISSINYEVLTRTTFKAPFVQRSQSAAGDWTDDVVYPDGTGNRAACYLGLAASQTSINVRTDAAADGWIVGDVIAISLSDGTTHTANVTAVNPFTGEYSNIEFDTVTPAVTVADWANVYQNPLGREIDPSHTVTFASGLEPYAIMIGMRVDYPTLDIGEWYFAGTGFCYVNFKSAEQPSVMWAKTATETTFTGTDFNDTEAYEWDMDTLAGGYQIYGDIRNDNDGTTIGVNTVLNHLYDRLVLDCEKRTFIYYHYDIDTDTWQAGESRYEALTFGDVRDYWIKLYPDQDESAVHFVHNANSNFRNLDVKVRWKLRFY